MTEWLTDEQQEAWRGLLQMTTRLNARLNRHLQDEHGLSLADYEVLVVLSEAPENRLRVFELIDELGWEQSRLSHHLVRMQRRGLVERIECPTDGRGTFVALTRRGLAAIEAAAPSHVDAVRTLVFDDQPADQVAALAALSATVLDRLDGPRAAAARSPA
jgi:DNA-binding MarR family transcriptional regulator